MFGLFGGKKKKEDKEKQVAIGSEISINQSVQQMTVQADEVFLKPKYNPQTRKTHYDDGTAHKTAKENAFSSSGVVKDPYTGIELVHTIKEAKIRFGDDWQGHLAEADHIDPLNQIAKRAENNPWVSSEDVKKIGNSQDNIQVISRRMNQTGGKGGSTQTEWSQDYERMQRISKQTGEPIESIAEKIRQTGIEAEKRNNAKLTMASVRNAATTAHTAGKVTAVNSGGTAATISAIYNVVSCVSGEKTTSEALKDIGKDGSKALVSGYVRGAGLTVLNHTLTSSNSGLLVALGENNVAGKIITTVAVTGETIVKWGNGEISTEECLVELGDKGCSFGGASYGYIVGQAVIPIPIVGGAVGSLIGGVLASEVYNGVIQGVQSVIEEERCRQQEIYEAVMRYYAEQQRREEVQELIRVNTEMAVIHSVQTIVEGGEFQRLINEAGTYFRDKTESERRIAECVLITLQLREYRRQLQEYIDKYFSEYDQCFTSALDLMDSCLAMGDYDGAMAATNQVTELFGKKPVVEDTEDFKKVLFGNERISF